MIITPVNGHFLVEPILRTETETADLRKKYSHIAIPDAKTNNFDKFEGIPNMGKIRYLPETYKGILKVGDQVVFKIDKPDSIKMGEIKLFAIQEDQLVAVIKEDD